MSWLAALLVLLALGGPARAVDVSQLSDFENDPCVIGLAERNTAQKIGAPDSALSDACERAHGSVEVGWDIILRTWKAPDVGQASATTVRRGAPASLFALLGMLLATAALGWPIRAVLLAAPATPVPGRLIAEAALSLAGRLVVGTALLAVLTVRYAPWVAALLLLVSILRRPRLGAGPGRGSAAAEILAGASNDVAANLPYLLGVALFAQGNFALLTAGVLLAIPLSWPAVARPWRRLRGTPVVGAALSAVAAFAAFAGQPQLGLPIASLFALVVLWRGGAVGWPRAVSRQRQSPPQVPGV